MNPTNTTLLLATVAVLTLNASCSEPSMGQAVPRDESPPVGSGISVPPTSAANGGGRLEGLDPCSLVMPAEVDQFGAQQGKRVDTSRTPACRWQILGGNGLFSLALLNDRGLNNIVVDLGTPVDQQVGNHKGKILKDDPGPNSGECMVSIGITESSRVDVRGQYKNDTAVACDRALKVAGLVEPRLPKGE